MYPSIKLPPSKWHHGSPTVANFHSAYRQTDSKILSHHLRRRSFIERMPHKLTCQECGGSGGEIVPILDYGQGPFEPCGFCEGEGLVTPYERGLWLRLSKQQPVEK